MAKIGTAYIEVDADLDPFLRKVKELRAHQFKAKVEVEADLDQASFKRASAQADKLAGDKDIKFKADPVESSFIRVAAKADKLGAKREDIKVKADFDGASAIAKAGLLNNVLDDLTGGTDRAALSFHQWFIVLSAGSSIIADLAGAITALGGSLGQAVAGLGALGIGGAGAGAVGFGGIISVVAPAIKSLGTLMTAQKTAQKGLITGAKSAGTSAKASAQAVKSANNQVIASHEAVKNAVDGLTTAEDSLSDAQRAEAIAQGDLTRARFDATRQLQDLKQANIEAQTAEQRATLSVQQARQNLLDVTSSGTASALDIRDAQLGVTEAIQQQTDAQTAAKRAQQDFNRAQKQGVDGMPQVVAAQRNLADAQRQVVQAQRGVVQAERSVADAHRQVAEAVQNLAYAQEKSNQQTGAGARQMAALRLAQKQAGPEAVKFVLRLHKLGVEWRRLTQAGKTDFFKTLNQGLTRVQDKLPLLAKSANTSLKAFDDAFTSFFKQVTGPDFKEFTNVMTKTFAAAMPKIAAAAGDFAQIFERIAIAVAPDLLRELNHFQRWADSLLEATDNSKKLRDNVHNLVTQFDAWRRLLVNVGKLFLAIFGAGANSGKGLVNSLNKTIVKWTNYIQTHQKAVHQFFGQAADTARTLGDILTEIVSGPLSEIISAMRPISDVFLRFFRALNNIKIGNISALTALLGAFVVTKSALNFLTYLSKVKKAWAGIRNTAGEAAAVEEAASGGGGFFPTIFGRGKKAAKVPKVGPGVARTTVPGPFTAGARTKVPGALTTIPETAAAGLVPAIPGAIMRTKTPVPAAITKAVPREIPGAFGLQGGKVIGAGASAEEIAALAAGGGGAEAAGATSLAASLAELGPAGAIAAAALAGVAAAVLTLKTNFLGITDFLKGTFKDFAGSFKDLVDQVSGGHATEVFKAIGTAFSFLFKIIKPALPIIVKIIGTIFLITTLGPTIAFIKGLTLAFKGLAAIIKLGKAAFSGIGDALKFVGHIAGIAFKAVIGGAKDAFGFIADKWKTISNILTYPFRLEERIVKTVFHAIIGAVKTVFNFIKNHWDQISHILTAPFRGLASVVKDAFGAVKGVVQGVINFIKDHFPVVTITTKHVGVGPVGVDVPVPQVSFGLNSTPTKKPNLTPFGAGEHAGTLARQGRTRAHGARGGFVSPFGIHPLHFAAGGLVPGTGNRDSVAAMLTPGELVLSVDQVKRIKQAKDLALDPKVAKDTKKRAQDTAKGLTDELSKGHKKAKDDTKQFTKDHDDLLNAMRQASNTDVDNLAQHTVQKFQSFHDATLKASGNMKKGVVSDYQNMASGSVQGIKKLEDETNKALKALGVKPVKFGVSDTGKSNKPGGKQTGGYVVPGSGSGDKVHMEAMVEPGERVFVLNRNASSHLAQLQALNRGIPRFQKGGLYRYPFPKGIQLGRIDQGVDLQQAGVPIGAIGDATVTSNFNAFSPQYGNANQGMVYKLYNPPKGYAPSSPYVFIYEGLDKVKFGSKLTAGQLLGHIHSGFPGIEMGWAAGPNGPALAHDHYTEGAQTAEGKSFMRFLMDLSHGKAISGGGTTAQKIKRVLLRGPLGPLLDLGQAAVDKVHSAANRYVAKHQPSGLTGGLGGFISGPGGNNVVKVAGAILMKAGLDRIAAAAVLGNAYGESTWNPGAIEPGTDNGGLWGFTASPVSRQDLVNYAKKQGKSWTDVATQTNFLLAHFSPGHEGFSRGYVNQLNSETLNQAVIDFVRNWEKAGVEAIARREQGARLALKIGFQGGGELPYLGKYHSGGYVPRDGMAFLQGGEIVLPKLRVGGLAGVGEREKEIRQLAKILAAFPLSKKQAKELEKLEKKQQRDKLNDKQAKKLKRLENIANQTIKKPSRSDERALEELQKIKDRKGHFTNKAQRDLYHELKHSARLFERQQDLINSVALDKELLAEFKELRKDLREHNRLVKSTRNNQKAALQAVVDLTSAQIGYQANQRSRSAAAGSTRSY